MNTASLNRTPFSTSRLLDFLSEKELTVQIGHAKPAWSLVAVKELGDNALDACEEAGTPPEIEIVVDGEGITVADNGPWHRAGGSHQNLGLLSSSSSSREAYIVRPTGVPRAMRLRPWSPCRMC